MAAAKKNRRWWSDRKVQAMHRDHLGGLTMKAVARKHGVTNHASVWQAFKVRGLKRIIWPEAHFQKTHRAHSKRAIVKIIRGLRSLHVPPVLAYEWRHWPMKKRAWFIRTARKALGIRPLPKCSANVRRFDYTTPAAHRIAARLNAGHTSRTHPVKLKPHSRGVIYDGKLWFWSSKHGYLHQRTHCPRSGRMLHHHLYEQHHGPVPPGGVVRFRDGNPHNLMPENLTLAGKEDVARETRYRLQKKRSRAATAALLHLTPHTRKKGRSTRDELAKILRLA